ncbi:MAG: type 4b pilus protein PilO2 [Sterolibacterium sp.]|nr:type 4b pilus protein PilO2 [Sterolibacterium sp.]
MAKELATSGLSGSGFQTFEFGRRTFVCGLFWQPLPGATARLRMVELQKMAEEQGFDLAVLRTSGIPQAGFGSQLDGIKPGMLSAAAMISKSLEVANRDRSFLCAMEVPGKKWLYVAQREGVLLHDGDLLGTEEDIRGRMRTDLSLADWQTVFAPAHWGISHSVERQFEELLPKKGDKYSFKKWWEIRLIRNIWLDLIKNNPKLHILLIALVLFFGGYQLWEHYRLKNELEALEQKEAAEQAARELAAAEQPWKKQAPAAQFVAACATALNQVNTLWPGNWTPTTASCAEGNFVLSWSRRETGQIEHLLALQPNAEVSSDGTQAKLTIPLELPAGTNETLPKERERLLTMLDFSQRYGIGLTVKDAASSAILGQPSLNDGSWSTLEWKIADTLLSPATILPVLDAPGLRINKIALSFGEGTMKWTMEGMQYVQTVQTEK